VNLLQVDGQQPETGKNQLTALHGAGNRILLLGVRIVDVQTQCTGCGEALAATFLLTLKRQQVIVVLHVLLEL